MSEFKHRRTPGGIALRTLREAHAKTQLDVELDANLGIGYLQRVERGKVQHPERETLERIMQALGATYAETRTIFDHFGYIAPISLPTEAEIHDAIAVFHHEVQQDTLTMPVYLLDCSHRLLAWNALVPMLFEAVTETPDFVSMPRLVFDPAYEIKAAIVNEDAFFSAQIHVLHYENQRCGDAAWFQSFIDDMRGCVLFDRYWTRYDDTPSRMMTRPLAQLQLKSQYGELQFRVIAQHFAQDPRFRMIYYLPADPVTIHQCQAWIG